MGLVVAKLEVNRVGERIKQRGDTGASSLDDSAIGRELDESIWKDLTPSGTLPFAGRIPEIRCSKMLHLAGCRAWGMVGLCVSVGRSRSCD